MPQISMQDSSVKPVKPTKPVEPDPIQPSTAKPARLFIAILFDEETLDVLEDAVSSLRELSSAGRFVKRENLHLTLAFLGQVERNRIDALKQVLAEVVASATSRHAGDLAQHLNKADDHPVMTSQQPNIHLALTGTGRFKQRKGNTCWVGIEAVPWLVELHDKLVATLFETGFSVDLKPFKPHITVGRDIVLKEESDNGSSFNRWQADSLPFTSPVSSVHLMESSMQERQLSYTSLFEQRLL